MSTTAVVPSPQTIPLTTAPNQTFQVPLNIDGTVKAIYCTLRYNEVSQEWFLTIANGLGQLYVDSLPLVTGNSPASNILRQFAYLGIGSAFVINVSGVTSPDFPNDTDLGTDYILIWDSTPAQ
jgi:hypothetical protein